MKKRHIKKKYYRTCAQCKFYQIEFEPSVFSYTDWCEKTDNEVYDMVKNFQKCKLFKRDPKPKCSGISIGLD